MVKVRGRDNVLALISDRREDRLAGPQFSESAAVFPVIEVEQRQAGAGHL
jgi:hypothetical protein